LFYFNFVNSFFQHIDWIDFDIQHIDLSKTWNNSDGMGAGAIVLATVQPKQGKWNQEQSTKLEKKILAFIAFLNVHL